MVWSVVWKKGRPKVPIRSGRETIQGQVQAHVHRCEKMMRTAIRKALATQPEALFARTAG